MGLIIDQPQPITERLYLERSSLSVRLWNSSRYCKYSRKLIPVVAVVVVVRSRPRRGGRRPLPLPLPLLFDVVPSSSGGAGHASSDEGSASVWLMARS